jgi:Spy/CpxP family protein refolding chaperone
VLVEGVYIKVKTSTKALIAVSIVGAATVGGFFAYLAHASPSEARPPTRRPFARKLAQLGINQDQRAQIKEILRQYQPTVEPMIRQVVTERRALRDTIRAETIDESVIRAQAAKLASLECDLAVQRAHVAHEIRAVLTPEQLQKLKGLQVDVDARIDGVFARIAKRLADD